MISLFDMFKVGIGPSSSHTVGPMKAGKQFVDDLVEKGLLDSVTRVAVDVYGSLSLTGKGHHTDIAIIMGLAGNEPCHRGYRQYSRFYSRRRRARTSAAGTGTA
ncbi:serine dehydratase beta chain [Escherichia coli]